LWIGFPIGGNKLLRVGLVSIDKPDSGRLRWSFSLFEITLYTRTIRVMLPVPVQYLTEIRLDANRIQFNQNKATHAFKLLW
jgi:hypothetical protein